MESGEENQSNNAEIETLCRKEERMKSPIPIFLTCKECGHIHSESLQDAVAGKLASPLLCPRCSHVLDIDWDWIDREALLAGLVRPTDPS
jgi:hypothetical protein